MAPKWASGGALEPKCLQMTTLDLVGVLWWGGQVPDIGRGFGGVGDEVPKWASGGALEPKCHQRTTLDVVGLFWWGGQVPEIGHQGLGGGEEVQYVTMAPKLASGGALGPKCHQGTTLDVVGLFWWGSRERSEGSSGGIWGPNCHQETIFE